MQQPRRFKAQDLTVDTKPDLTPVTDADRAVEEMLRITLSRARTRDAVMGEEFGLIGNVLLLVLYLLLISRAMMITANASTLFARLLSGAITLMFFTYAFVNMGMVSGVLPVVGVPLPLVSYGGTALVSLFIGLGVLMSVQAHRKLVVS